MSNLKKPFRVDYIKHRQQIMMILLLGILLLPVLIGSVYVWKKHQWAANRIAELEPRYARLAGLQAKHDDILKTIEQAKTSITQYVYPSNLDATQAGNDAQQRVRNILSQAQLDVISSQILPPKIDRSFDRIPLSVRIESNWIAIQSALIVLTAQSPVILLDGFNVQSVGAARGEVQQRLSVQLNLSVLRERNPNENDKDKK